MKQLFCILVLSSMSLATVAHPGVGIVEDSKGNIYYTDLKQVLRIGPDGKITVAVRGVHTHELYLDEQDNLYGEHLWYNGERLDTWGHYVWRLDPDGKFTKVIPDKEGFLENYSFVRDHFGRMYWADRTNACQHVVRKNADNTTAHLGSHCFNNIRWMQSGKEGMLYVIDFQDLKTMDPKGNVKTVASKIADRSMITFNTSNQHSVMGVWDDPSGNIYTAIASGRKVKMFTPAGAESVAFETSFPWSPSGGLVDTKGNLWVLEYSVTNAVRVEKLIKGNKTMVFQY